MRPHVHVKGGIVGEFLVAILAAEARSVFGLAERPLEVGEHVLLQGGVGGESAAARPHRAFERRLARVGQPVQVQALLGHAAVATQVALDLRGEEDEEGGMEGGGRQQVGGEMKKRQRKKRSGFFFHAPSET